MKIWDKPATAPADVLTKSVADFTIGSDQRWDLVIAPYDVKASLAHAEMLQQAGLMTEDELRMIKNGLQEIGEQIAKGNFRIEEQVEDVHSQIEFMLTRYAGEAGKKIHTARSRNDQALTAIKLYIRDEIKAIAEIMRQCFDLLQSLSEKHKSVLLPGYTHQQVAMPSSFGLWFGAYAESFADDLELLLAAYHVADQNPLGSAAGYGSSLPINRQYTTDQLGFAGMNVNVVYAQMTRGKTEKITAMALSVIAGTLNKLAVDVCMFVGQNYHFISFPTSITTGSSIMPHKKNPDVFELIRARTNRLQALPNELVLLTTNLPSGYHRDFQLTKECLFPAFSQLRACFEMVILAFSQISVRTDILDDERYRDLFSVEEVNRLVQQGIPFREAYRIVGKEINEGSFKAEKQIQHTHEGSMGNLMNEKIAERFKKLYTQLH